MVNPSLGKPAEQPPIMIIKKEELHRGCFIVIFKNERFEMIASRCFAN